LQVLEQCHELGHLTVCWLLLGDWQSVFLILNRLINLRLLIMRLIINSRRCLLSFLEVVYGLSNGSFSLLCVFRRRRPLPDHLVVPLVVVEAHEHRPHRALERLVSLDGLPGFEIHFLGDQLINILRQLSLPSLLCQNQRLLLRHRQQVVRLPLQILNHHFNIVQLDALSKKCGSRGSTKLTGLLAMLDVLEITIEKVFDEIVLDVFHWVRLEVIALDMMRFELLQVRLQIIIKNLGSHLAFEARPFVEIIVDLLLELNEALVLSRHFQLQQIFRNELLSVYLVEELLECDQIPRGFLGVLQLPELDKEDVLKLLEVLLHVVDSDPSRAIELHLFDFGIEIASERSHTLFESLQLLVALVHEELIISKR